MGVQHSDNKSTIVPPSLALTPPYTNVGGFDRNLVAPRNLAVECGAATDRRFCEDSFSQTLRVP
jgi:hypothetical protein